MNHNQEVLDLEDTLKDNLMKTGLFKKVEIYNGDLKNPNNPWCLNHKLKGQNLKIEEKKQHI
jgi:hypothetical protein